MNSKRNFEDNASSKVAWHNPHTFHESSPDGNQLTPSKMPSSKILSKHSSGETEYVNSAERESAMEFISVHHESSCKETNFEKLAKNELGGSEAELYSSLTQSRVTETDVDSNFGVISKATEVNPEDNLYQHSSSEDEALVEDNKQSTENLMFDPTSLKNLLEVSDHASLLRCQLCVKEVGKAQIIQHLTEQHKCHLIVANHAKSLLKETKRTKLQCRLCGKFCTSLTSHLKQFHGSGILEALSIIKEAKNPASEFDAYFNRYVAYLEKESMSYRPERKYLNESHLRNISRIAHVMSENNINICDFLDIPDSDQEAEELSQGAILSFIQTMKHSGKSPDTAVVYLNDLKKFIHFFYRFKSRVPFSDFILKQISKCKISHNGKMNLNECMDHEQLAIRMADHYTCPLATSIQQTLQHIETPMQNLECRNYLMTRLMVENIKSVGAICNITIKEFETAVKARDDDGVEKVTIVVAGHNTSSISCPSNIHASSELYLQIKKYVDFLRPPTECNYLFVTEKGNSISSSCAWGIFQKHLSLCNIGIPDFNANSLRHAGNSINQQRGDESLIENNSWQQSHNTVLGRTIDNDVSTQKCAEGHTNELNTMFSENSMKRKSCDSRMSSAQDKSISLSAPRRKFAKRMEKSGSGSKKSPLTKEKLCTAEILSKSSGKMHFSETDNGLIMKAFQDLKEIQIEKLTESEPSSSEAELYNSLAQSIETDVDSNLDALSRATEVNPESNLHQHSSSHDEAHEDDDKQSAGTLMFDPTSIKNILEVSDQASLLRCQLCVKEVGKAQIKRHLTKQHKCHLIVANHAKSLLKQTKKTKLQCRLCGKFCTSLTSHLIKFHGSDSSEAFSIMKEAKIAKNPAPEYSPEFDAHFNRYVAYIEKESVGYKSEGKYFKESHLKNISRMAHVMSENDINICDFLDIPDGDQEAEELSQGAILSFIQTMKHSGKSPDTAIVYLNDLKKFINFFYRFKSRVPFSDFILKQISKCKISRNGKMNLNECMDHEQLAIRMANHYTCPLATSIQQTLQHIETPMQNLECRNYLMTRLLVENIKSVGAICNITMKEFETAVKARDDDGVEKVTIVVAGHNTSSISCPLNIHASTELYLQIKKYVDFLRPHTECNYLFVTEKGNSISSSCAWGIFQKHLSLCNIGIPDFNANSLRHAGNSINQQRGDGSLIENNSWQQSHNTVLGRTIDNDVSTQKCAEGHTNELNTMFSENPMKRKRCDSHMSSTQNKSSTPPDNHRDLPRKREKLK